MSSHLLSEEDRKFHSAFEGCTVAPSGSIEAHVRLAVRHFMDKSPSESAGDFTAKNPELLDSKIMLTHYSASVRL